MQKHERGPWTLEIDGTDAWLEHRDGESGSLACALDTGTVGDDYRVPQNVQDWALRLAEKAGW